ncbi:MAG: DUF1861 family protein [Candidatus Izemoplasmatales bacterium]|jgi:hypothetical protein
MIEFVSKPTPLVELLKEKSKRQEKIRPRKLKFRGALGFDLYNPSHEFNFDGDCYIAVRVEKRDSEISGVRIFKKSPDNVYDITDFSFQLLQDPFVTKIEGEIVFGGTAIEIDGKRKIVNWHTDFYKGPSLKELKFFLKAPDKMKDVRLHEHEGIHVFTRPQGGTAGPGKIGYFKANSLKEVTSEKIADAAVLDSHFASGEWGGVNQVLTLDNGLLGIVGHIAKMTGNGTRNYYGMVFCFDPFTKSSSKIKIISERSDFPPGPSKRSDLYNVIFPGGIIRQKKGFATLYAGLSDAQIASAIIPDPFKEYEE